jgi:ABC-type bacteriocin/lantibiotic exporter with double-glycine peptidase domain
MNLSRGLKKGGLGLLCFMWSQAFLDSSVAQSLCGPQSLLVICQHFSIQTDIQNLCRLSNWKEGVGVTIWGLYQAARSIGLQAQGLKIDLESLKSVKNPCIVLISNRTNRADRQKTGHFCVVDHITSDSIIIKDYPNCLRSYSLEEFTKIWGGYTLIFRKGSS